MNKLAKIVYLGIALIVIATMSRTGFAGPRDGAIAIDQGDSPRYRVVTVSSTTGTALWDRQDTVDSVCRVNGSYIVWIGSTSATQHNKTHDNITYGFFLLANETITMGGAYTGKDFVTCTAGTASCELRCRDSVKSY